MQVQELTISREAMGTPEGVLEAIMCVLNFSDNGPAISTALASALADCLRTAPAEIRGHATEHMLELIRRDIRASLT